MLAWIALIFFGLALFGVPLIYLYQVIRDLLKFFLNDWWNTKLFFVKVDPHVSRFLEGNFRYYQQLPDKSKIIFAKRVHKFRSLKNFEGRQSLKVTEEMEIVVSASAIQLTFGFPSVYLDHFDTILLYPDVYHSTITGNYHRGEVNEAGYIVLSWKHFLEGYLNHEDGRNLGLHEMAHALKISDYRVNPVNNFFDRDHFHHFMVLARNEMISIAEGNQSLFREYAATNDHEFFAVAIENFFERSQDFIAYHPDLYRSMVKLLNQDPR